MQIYKSNEGAILMKDNIRKKLKKSGKQKKYGLRYSGPANPVRTIDFDEEGRPRRLGHIHPLFAKGVGLPIPATTHKELTQNARDLMEILKKMKSLSEEQKQALIRMGIANLMSEYIVNQVETNIEDKFAKIFSRI